MQRRNVIALTLLAATIATTTVWGAIYCYGYFGTQAVPFFAPLAMPRFLALGFALYSVPLLLILGAHEMGHYLVLRRAGLPASLPWFIPLPPPIGASGTFGAVIDLRATVPDRRTLVRVAAAGPLAGLAVAVLVLVAGFALTPKVAAAAAGTHAGGLTIQTPLLYDAFAWAMHVPADASVHPLAIAGWLGLFVTAIQLLPAGQLDGGHVLRAFAGRAARVVGWIVVAALVVAAFVVGFYGWLAFALVIWATGLRQPPPDQPGDISGLDVALALLCLATLVVTFVPRPFAG